MNMNDRPSPGQRGDALVRLRTVTAGVAVAGVAATAGFGFAAASGFRGTATAVDTAGDPGTNGAAVTQAPVRQRVPGDDDQQPQTDPQGNGFQAPAIGNPVPPPTRTGTRRSHASTGGSG